jgi:hypothetical protein
MLSKSLDRGSEVLHDVVPGDSQEPAFRHEALFAAAITPVSRRDAAFVGMAAHRDEPTCGGMEITGGGTSMLWSKALTHVKVGFREKG